MNSQSRYSLSCVVLVNSCVSFLPSLTEPCEPPSQWGWVRGRGWVEGWACVQSVSIYGLYPSSIIAWTGLALRPHWPCGSENWGFLAGLFNFCVWPRRLNPTLPPAGVPVLSLLMKKDELVCFYCATEEGELFLKFFSPSFSSQEHPCRGREVLFLSLVTLSCSM